MPAVAAALIGHAYIPRRQGKSADLLNFASEAHLIVVTGHCGCGAAGLRVQRCAKDLAKLATGMDSPRTKGNLELLEEKLRDCYSRETPARPTR